MKDARETAREMTAEEKTKYSGKSSSSGEVYPGWMYEREKETSVKIKVKQVEPPPSSS